MAIREDDKADYLRWAGFRRRSEFSRKAATAPKPVVHQLNNQIRMQVALHSERTYTIDAPIMASRHLTLSESAAFSDGVLLLNRFRIVNLRGRGGMGEVYEAHDLELGRVALKTVRLDIANNTQMLFRFKREVQLARRVTSCNVCRIHELFMLDNADGRPPSAFLTMEFLEGTTLADRIAQNNPFSWEETQLIAAQLCSGLQAIHEAGIIHRDLKSRNVMLTRRRGMTQAVIMDLGIAHDAALSTGDSIFRAANPGALAGTPGYMAPEQFQGEALTPATDMYALGMVLQELLTGKHPFQNPGPNTAAPLNLPRPNVPSRAGRRWIKVIEKCLAHHPRDRYQSAAEVAEALREKGAADLLRVPEIGAKHTGQNRALLVILFGLALFLTGTVFWPRAETSNQLPAEAQHWYNQGLEALHEGTLLKAVREFQNAIKVDKNAPMPHVRLAQAWAELGFTGQADEELRRAKPETTRILSQFDKVQLQITRDTLANDFTKAFADCKLLLNTLPVKDKSYGYVDLGKIAEKSGRIEEALKYYTEAIRLRNDQPAAFVRRGILEVLQEHSAEAESDFAAAERYFQSSIDFEGLAELDFQRSYAALQQGNLSQAEQFAKRSLSAAQEIQSVQLETRALSLMSVIYGQLLNFDLAVKTAHQAIQIAQNNGLGYWVTYGQLQLGDVYIGNPSKVAEAELSLQSAYQAAHQNNWPGLEADARIRLAALRNIQHKPEEAVVLAQAALNFYQQTGFLKESAIAQTQMIESLMDQQRFDDALQSSLDLIAKVERYHNPALTSRAEEATGSVLLNLQRFPEALSHLQSALAANHNPDRVSRYDALECADALWQLGRFREAEQLLESLPVLVRHQQQFIDEESRIRAKMLLSQGRNTQALQKALQALQSSAGMRPSMILDFETVAARAESKLGNRDKARTLSNATLQLAKRLNDHQLTAYASLIRAAIEYESSNYIAARPFAEAAKQYFSKLGKEELKFQSLFYLAEAYRGANMPKQANAYAEEALTALSKIERRWGTANFQAYLNRPDINQARNSLLTAHHL